MKKIVFGVICIIFNMQFLYSADNNLDLERLIMHGIEYDLEKFKEETMTLSAHVVKLYETMDEYGYMAALRRMNNGELPLSHTTQAQIVHYLMNHQQLDTFEKANSVWTVISNAMEIYKPSSDRVRSLFQQQILLQ